VSHQAFAVEVMDLFFQISIVMMYILRNSSIIDELRIRKIVQNEIQGKLVLA
jgi:hypothetical protein